MDAAGIKCQLRNPGLAEQNCQLPVVRLPFDNCSYWATSETYVHSTGILLGVGSTAIVSGMASTAVNSTLIQLSDVFSDRWLTLTSGSTHVTIISAQYRSRRGGFVDRGDWKAASSEALSSLSGDIDTPFQYVVETGLRIQDHHIGFAESSKLLQPLKNLDAGPQSFTAPRNGSLVLGGYDASNFMGGWFSYSISKLNLVSKRSCPFQVQITAMESTTQVGRNKMLVEKPMGGANPLTACIEP
ncbi:hypothetical protein QL093DRAFT_2565686 [Fusarium oxysporum]|nr:hypothetical protein QL093DRAFT_2565686 [Fusarium oxysporum]